MLGLYIHIPFCSAICNYCNFNRGLFDGALKACYVEALVREIGAAGAGRAGREKSGGARGDAEPGGEASGSTRAGGARLRQGSGEVSPKLEERRRSAADTIYFGGGTPSLLEPGEVGRIIDACRQAYDLAEDAEITLEANPESVTTEHLAAFRRAGVNRLSFGVQSFADEELRRLSRLHSAARARDAYREARTAGFDNISLDLMMWLPGQAIPEWLRSVDAAIELEPDHLSLYLLEVYPNAPLKDEMARSRWSQAPDEDAASMYVEAMERLDTAGLEQYEISNVARAGRQSRHNLKYWSDGEWLGFGCGAHSTRDGVRWRNVSATQDYVTRIARGDSTATDVRQLSDHERLGDALFTGLRLTSGVDMEAIGKRYAVDVWERYGRELEPFLESGVLTRMDGRLALTRQGMLVAHEVMLVFV